MNIPAQLANLQLSANYQNVTKLSRAGRANTPSDMLAGYDTLVPCVCETCPTPEPTEPSSLLPPWKFPS